MLPIEIRNEVSFRKALMLTTKSFFYVNASKLWNVHLNDLEYDATDFHEAKDTVAIAMVSNVAVLEIINKLHQQSEQTVLEDLDITLVFFEQCRRAVYGEQ